MSEIFEIEDTYTSGVYGKRPVALVRGSGALVWDEQGRELIDCTAGYGVANIGHAHPELAATLAAQAQRLVTCPEFVYNDVRARLLERLAQITPDGLDHFFLCNSGTEAIEGAFKFARLATGRTSIIATLRGFHGRTMGALSATWEPHYREPFAPLVPDVRHVRYNDLAVMERAMGDNTAAVIIELVQGEGGVHVADDEYVQGLVQLCRERGALLIVDEVQTGFGRTGRMFACEHYNLQPDILCLAKSVAGGIPMGVVCLGQRVIESGRISKGVHGSTFGGNPLACAAALKTIDILEREELPARAERLGNYAIERLRSLNSPLIREVRGRGLLIGIELKGRIQSYLEALLERGVLVLQAGPNVLRLLPPLVITQEQIDRVIDAIADVLGENTTTSYRQEMSDNPHGRPQGSITSSNGSGGNPCGRPCVPGDDALGSRHEISLLQQMLTIPSYSYHEQALARYLVEQAPRMGLHARVDEVGNFIAGTDEALVNATHHSHTAHEPIVMLGHMDTVGGYIPVRIEENRLYGRGAVDAKGPLAAFLSATSRVTQSGQDGRPVLVIGAVQEEAATSLGARAVVERYRPSACIIGEPSGSRAVTIGYKGRLLVEVRAAQPMSHSAGPQRTSSERATAFWERVRIHAETWNAHTSGAFAALMPSLRRIDSTQNGFEEQTSLLIGYRLPPNFDIAGLRQQLEQWASEEEVHLTFSGEERAFQSTRTTPLARAFIGALRETGSQAIFKHKTGTSDMNVVGPVWGNNIVAYGPGDSRLDHTPNEHIELNEYLYAIDVLEHVLRNLTIGQQDTVLVGRSNAL
ncbi:MAG TPA: hypothetical protein DHW02_18335 [Ktedonobacter sp.]|nr:hypothetical protein [Ktedonobacter sp.]